MDDCNEAFSAVYEAALRCSDSSMDDCNNINKSVDRLSEIVQIPLWTIVTNQLEQ